MSTVEKFHSLSGDKVVFVFKRQMSIPALPQKLDAIKLLSHSFVFYRKGISEYLNRWFGQNLVFRRIPANTCRRNDTNKIIIFLLPLKKQ